MNDQQIVAGDLPCVACGYNLRTLAREGKCPECGAEVVRSMESGFAGWGKDYLMQLSKVVGGMAALNGLVVVMTLGAFAAGRGDVLFKGVGIGLLGGYAVVAVGHAMLAFWLTKEPRMGRQDLFRGEIRGSAVAFSIGAVVIFVLCFFNQTLFLVLGGIGALVVVLPSLAVFSYQMGRFLEALCGTCGMIRCGRWNKWMGTAMASGLGIMTVILVIGFCLSAGAGSGMGEMVLAVVGFLGCSGVAVFVISFFGLIVVLGVTALEFRRLAERLD